MSAGRSLRIPEGHVVVLDVDDTLYLERSYVRSGFEAVGSHVEATTGVADVGATLWRGFEAGVRGDAFDQALAAHGLDATDELISELVECYRNHRPRIELLADASRLLDRMGGRPAAAITDGPALSQRAKVEALGLARWVDPIIVTSELGPGHGKPDPLPYRLVEETFGVPSEHCWYIGDNPTKDFISPVVRHWKAVRIRRRLSLHEAVPTPDRVVEIASLDELGC